MTTAHRARSIRLGAQGASELWARVEEVRRDKTRGGGPKNWDRVDLLGGLLEMRVRTATPERRQTSPTAATANSTRHPARPAIVTSSTAMPATWASTGPSHVALEHAGALLGDDAYLTRPKALREQRDAMALLEKRAVMARPTGVGRAHAHSGFRQLLIEGADEWRSAARESA